MTSKNTLPYCVEVAPLTSIPLSRSPFFTYSSSKPIPKGSLVSIPLFHRFVRGIVFESYPAKQKSAHLKHIQLKPVASIIQKHFLTQGQLDLAQFLSQEYYTSLGRCLIHFTPERAKSRKAIELPPAPLIPHQKNIRITSAQKAAIDVILSSQKKPAYLFGPASSGKTEVYMRSIKECIRHGAQALVLVPEMTLIPQEAVRYSAFFGQEKVAILHSALAPGAFFKTWQSIADNSVSVIIGTRQALFAPFALLGIIIVDEEQDDAYKQWDMSPRYDARTVVEQLAKIHKASLVFGSATPSIERFYKTETKAYRLTTLPHLPSQPACSIEITNMRLERWKKNISPLSETLASEIAFALKYKRQALLFINRQGASAFSVCQDCKHVLSCPHCERALVHESSNDTYRCLHCTHTTSSLPHCPHCRGIHFKNFGIGTQKVEREIRKRFPSARVARVDSQSMKQKNARENTYRAFAGGEIDILIGTQMATKGWDLPNVSLVGIIDADSLFGFPDFKTDENAFQILLQAVGRTARIGSPFAGKVIIQTFFPENPIIQWVQQRNFLDFYKYILQQRSDFKYPPFSRLVKIILQEKKEKIDKEAKKVYNSALEISKSNRSVRVFPPQIPLISRTRGADERRQIILQCLSVTFPAELTRFLVSISKTWAVDIDPIHIL